MLQLIGIRKHVNIHIREQLTLLPQKQKLVLENLSMEYEEVVIVSTCNRTEIYINDDKDVNKDLHNIFKILGWKFEFLDYCFVANGDKVVKHLLEVACGFHSRILGEDQILGQIKNAYQISIENNALCGELQRLFEEALSCGKRFRTQSKLFEIPVSASSISVIKAYEHNVKDLMIIGYGDVGKLVVKYALSHNFRKIYIVLRDKFKASDISDKRVTIIDFTEKDKYINNVDGIICCTASPHTIIKDGDIKNEGNNIVIFDLAVPRDVDKCLKNLARVKLYDIDDIGILDSENKKLRIKRMEENKWIVEESFNQFNQWMNVRQLSKDIKRIKEVSNIVTSERVKSFQNKCKDVRDIPLAKTLISSTSDYYVNRAISVLKEAKISGCEEECLKIIEKIFMIK